MLCYAIVVYVSDVPRNMIYFYVWRDKTAKSQPNSGPLTGSKVGGTASQGSPHMSLSLPFNLLPFPDGPFVSFPSLVLSFLAVKQLLNPKSL